MTLLTIFTLLHIYFNHVNFLTFFDEKYDCPAEATTIHIDFPKYYVQGRR